MKNKKNSKCNKKMDIPILRKKEPRKGKKNSGNET